MGCFDTIDVPCPHCGTMYPAQSKGGECLLGEYALYDAPEDVMADANRHAPFVCHACKAVFEVDIKNRQTVKLDTTAEEVRQEMFARMSCGDPSQGRNEVEANVIAALSTQELHRLRLVEAELKMIRETAQAWLSYKGIEHRNSDDLYAAYVIEAILRGEKPGK